MKKTILLTMILMTTVLAGGAFAADDEARPLVSVSPYLGMGLWSDDTGLDNSFLFGGRGAFHFTRRFALEGTYGMSTAEHADSGLDVDLKHYAVDLVWDLMPRGRFTPYLTAGWAQIDFDADGADRTEVLNGPGAGLGLKTRLWGDSATNGLLRIDVRDVMSNLTPSFPNDDDLTHNLIATAGLQFSFGSSSKDSDGDGVRDKDDRCDDTPAGVLVDLTGCPLDTDGDGVFDGLDQCTETPAGARVDATGCAMDSDDDGVFDGLDRCEGTDPKLAVDEHGCPIEVVETEVVRFEPKTVTDLAIRFDVDSSDIRVDQNAKLRGLVATIAEWPQLQLEIVGHADETGTAEYNQTLSEQRAAAVRDAILAASDIDPAQLTTSGKGETQPVAVNDTEEGRQANRRVEFHVVGAENLQREIEIRKLMER